jgi:hypothetical protein
MTNRQRDMALLSLIEGQTKDLARLNQITRRDLDQIGETFLLVAETLRNHADRIRLLESVMPRPDEDT